MAPDALPDPLAVAVITGWHFERLRVPYVIGGSFASSLHGEPRSTNDVDVVADLDRKTAQRQWRDVLAVLRAQQRLDDIHLRTWADRLGVADLLVRAQSEVKRNNRR